MPWTKRKSPKARADASSVALAGESYVGASVGQSKLQASESGLSFDDGLRLGADVNAVSRSTPDFRAAISAFLKK